MRKRILNNTYTGGAMNHMPTNIRLTNWEQEEIRKKSIEINKIRIKNGREPYKDSEMVHKILEISLPYIKVGNDGEVIVDPE